MRRQGRADAVGADEGSDADRLADRTAAAGAVTPPDKNRAEARDYDRDPHADRDEIERLFGRLEHHRRAATRYEKPGRNTSRSSVWRPR